MRVNAKGVEVSQCGVTWDGTRDRPCLSQTPNNLPLCGELCDRGFLLIDGSLGLGVRLGRSMFESLRPMCLDFGPSPKNMTRDKGPDLACGEFQE